MNWHYLDPSAWVKRFYREPGSDAVNALFRTMPRFACSNFGLIEMLATISRKGRGGTAAHSATARLVGDVRLDFSLFHVVAIDGPLAEQAAQLALVHGLRAMDAIHLGSALRLGPPLETTVVSSDAELIAAARLEGLEILDPAHSHP